jgi:SAM-dependent methyltransferase
VSSFWHPLSALLLPDPPSYSTSGLVRMLLRSQGSLELLYAGDRMWPAVEHGRRLRVRAVPEGKLPPGSVVAAEVAGIPDLLRAAGETEAGVVLTADADADAHAVVEREAILGVTELPRRRSSRIMERVRRLLLDHHEALTGRPDRPGDPASTVQFKYDQQAPFYASSGASLAEPLRQRVRDAVRRGGRILVAGSGCGTECFALAEEGWEVVGIDFAPRMVEVAAEEAGRRGQEITFRCADLVEHDEPAGSLAAVLFTYDFYSFLPDPSVRRRLLENIARWLEPGGCLLLSARRPGHLYGRWILTLQWLRRGAGGGWGRTHTRWVAADGELHRSFVQVHRDGALAREVRAAGFEPGPWEGGHAILRRTTREGLGDG